MGGGNAATVPENQGDMASKAALETRTKTFLELGVLLFASLLFT